MGKPSVLVLENGIDVTGSVVSAIRSCSSLGAEFEFVFILPRRSHARSHVEKRGFVVYEIPFLEISKSWKSLFYIPALFINLFMLRKIIEKSNARLMITNDFYNMLPALYKLLGGAVPYITFVRFIPSRFPAILVNIWCFFHYRLAEQVVAVSSIVKRNLKPHPKVTLVHNELPTGNGYRFYPYDPHSRILLYLSNYIQGKGLEYAIRAFASLEENYSDWTLRFVGSDMGLKKNMEYKKTLQALSEDLKVAHRITWGEFSENVVEEYRRASVVLNFSDSESFSLTTIEAMFVGRPVIATKCGGPEEIITPGLDGELVEVRDLEQMVSVLRKLLSNAALRVAYAEKAPVSVSSRFSLENTVYKLKPIYHQAIYAGEGKVSFS